MMLAEEVEERDADADDRALVTGRASAAGEVPLRRNRRFQALWIGGAGAYLGSSFTQIAVPPLILAVIPGE
jgi:hypothetical protein